MTTENYSFPLPSPDGLLEEDVGKLRLALEMIDAELNNKLPASAASYFATAEALSEKLDAEAASDFATALQGEKADSAVQPDDLHRVAGTGEYSDLTGAPDPDDYATAAQGGKADTAMQPGAGGWMGSALNMSSGHANDRQLGSFSYFTGTHSAAVAQGLPDLGIDGGDSVHWSIFTYGLSTRTVQLAVQVFDIDGYQSQQYIRVKESAAWSYWKQPSGSGGSGITTAPLRIFSANDQISNSITLGCDCTTDNHFPLDFTGTPLPSASGVYTINLTNLPAATTDLVVGHIEVKRAGRKTGVTIQASGFTSAWTATPSYQNTTNGVDVIQYMINPLTPTILRLSQVYSRST